MIPFEDKENVDMAAKGGIPVNADLIYVDLVEEDDGSAEQIVIDEEEDEDEDEDQDMVEEVTSNHRQPQVDQRQTTIPRADEFDKLALRLMKPVPDYPVASHTHNVWSIDSWSSLRENKIRGPRFKCGNYEWNVLLFPRGNNNTHVSIYLEPHRIVDENDPNKSDDWYVCAQFALDLWNPKHPECHIPSGSFHRFNKNDTDWGFSTFIDLGQLNSTRRFNNGHAILENNTLNVTAYVRIIDDSSTGVLWHSFMDYDSKASTGYVGLSNQGATCYLNSLLQSYFTTKIFRKLVYQIPTENHKKGLSVSLELQRIFILLLTSKDAVGTLELTKSFGWDSSDAFTQHDVQEMNRILMDRLESAMKGSPIDGSLNDIFVGKMKSYIKCVNVPYESSREEDFWDIQLNVKGFPNLQASFQNYIEIEMLDGENKYQAGDKHGYQDAKKGVVFQSFPPVLHLQLKRFEYDFMVDDMVKIDDFYEFPDSIDLKPYLDEDLLPELREQNWKYKLHGVLVHQGSISNGHYYAMIKPHATKDEWLRFDDDKVWKVTPTQVFQENYGAHELSSQEFARLTRAEQNENLVRRATSAYMLVYYRESELPSILPSDDESIDSKVPKHITSQIKAEIEERERIEKVREEASYYLNVKCVFVDGYNAYSGFDLYPDSTMPKYYDESLVEKGSLPQVFKMKKEDSILRLYEAIGIHLQYLPEGAEVTQSDVDSLPFRLLLVNHRNNHTNRTDTPIPPKLRDQTINGVYVKCYNHNFDEMVVFVEELRKDLVNVVAAIPERPSVDPLQFEFGNVVKALESSRLDVENQKFHDVFDYSAHITIFLKYYNMVENKVYGLTQVTVAKHSMIDSLTPYINTLLGFDKNTNLEYFEELSQMKIDPVNPQLSFEKQELSNGDILCVQSISDGKHNVQAFYNFLLTRLHIRVSPFKADKEEEDSDYVAEDEEKQKYPIGSASSHTCDIWVSTQYSYDDLAQTIAKNLGSDIDPEFLRLFIVNNQGIRYPLKSTHHLSQFFSKLIPLSQVTKFEYEILNIKLREYENMRSIKINWVNTLVLSQLYDLLIPKTENVAGLVNKLIHKADVSDTLVHDILVWTGKDHKYVDFVRFDHKIDSLPDNIDIYAGIFPAEVQILLEFDMIKRFKELPDDVNSIRDESTKQELKLAKSTAKKLNMIPAFHFYKSSTYHHGIPFIFPVYPDEKFERTAERLRQRLGVGAQAFSKIKIALADSNDKGRYLNTESSTLNLFEEVMSCEASMSLALDHYDRSPKRGSAYDKGISIR